MLKTILLLDGSEAMNSTAEYSPNYLFAVRQPLFRFVRSYLNSTTLASLGLVIMRDGVAKCVFPCTTNIRDLLTGLELHYFLYGGEGSLSLENGLRVSLAELLENPQQYLRGKRKRGVDPSATATSLPEEEEEWMTDAVQCRVVIFSASVTVIDPTDVLRVVRVFKKAKIQIDVISILGAVHIFQECAQKTGGQLYCPRNYKHLSQLLQRLAMGQLTSPLGKEKRFLTRHFLSGNNEKGKGGENGARRGPLHMSSSPSFMMKVGFPMWCEVEEEVKIKSEPMASSLATSSTTSGNAIDERTKNRSLKHVKKESTGQGNGEEAEDTRFILRLKTEGQQDVSHAVIATPQPSLPTSPPSHTQQGAPLRRGVLRLCCPACYHSQTSVPSTCIRCGLRLCSVPSLYAMFVQRNPLLPPVRYYHGTSLRRRGRSEGTNGEPTTEKETTEMISTTAAPFSSHPVPSNQHCEMCAFRVPAVVICCHCGVCRCGDCQKYCEEVLSLCPTCISLQ